jgi:hypothetical protein
MEFTWNQTDTLIALVSLLITLLGLIGMFLRNLKQDMKTDHTELKNLVLDIDRRLCRLEGAFSSKECCMLKDHRKEKAE